ncbi:MAG: site-specific integrase [Acidimicrobiales bacterium]
MTALVLDASAGVELLLNTLTGQSLRDQLPTPAAEWARQIEFAAFTGLRSGEMSALRIGQVDLRAGTVFVHRSASTVKGVRIEGEPKTRAGRRTVFLTNALGERLRSHLGERVLDRDGYVFAAEDDRPLNLGTSYSVYFKPTVRQVLPERLHGRPVHDLRHYASLLVEQGAHPKEMAELMGHSSVQITLDRYSHIMSHMAAALAERMDAAYRAAEPAYAPAADAGAPVVRLP